MRRSVLAYSLLERVFGRRRLWRLGRWLYTSARREVPGTSAETGEAALVRWLAAASPVSDKPPVLFDIGANLGEWTLSLAEAFAGRKARIFAFEPGPQQRAELERAVSPPSGAEIVIRSQAVGAECGQGRFEITGDTTGSSGLVSDHAALDGDLLEVEVTTIDAVMAAEDIDCLTFVKIDTEGNDLNVLKGASRALSEHAIGAVLFEYNWCWIGFHHTLRDVFELAAPLDYVVGRLTPDGIELYREWHFELDRFIMTNFLLVGPKMLDALPCTEWTFDAHNVAVPVAPKP